MIESLVDLFAKCSILDNSTSNGMFLHKIASSACVDRVGGNLFPFASRNEGKSPG